MTAITLQAQPGNGAIQLTITATEQLDRVMRSDANGVAEVRTLPGVFPKAAGGADLVLTDFEAASGAVSYTAGTATKSITWALAGPWLFIPVMPNLSVQLASILDYSAGGQSLGSVHELLGRSAPVAILRDMGSRRGSLRIYAGTLAQALRVVNAARQGQVLMLRQPEHQGMDMYFTATGYGTPVLETRGAGTVFGVDLSYIELDRPAGPLSGALGWTFAALASAWPSFATLPAKYATFQDVRLNQVKP